MSYLRNDLIARRHRDSDLLKKDPTLSNCTNEYRETILRSVEFHFKKFHRRNEISLKSDPFR